jgi:taurine--2-oxoglutarate transaminase
MIKEGVYTFGWVSHILIAPPLIITREELDRGLDVLDATLALSDARVTSSAAGSPPGSPRTSGS